MYTEQDIIAIIWLIIATVLESIAFTMTKDLILII